MATTADRLALLQRTKAGQRALLEKMYPDLDFSTVPFREYGRLFTGRKYVPGFVGGWKTYGRSNSEDPATRDILPDYSGNGRDIRLYNFAFAGMSGWNGYPYNFSDFQCLPMTAAYNTVSSTRLTANAITNGITFNLNVSHIPDGVFKAKLKITGLDANPDTTIKKILLYSNTSQEEVIAINEDGIYDIEYHMPEGASNFWVFCNGVSNTPVELATPIYIEQLPLYPGGLVSDGVDDYGDCVKGFALPDDYTVVAIRKPISSNGGAFASKGRITGAFLFEAGSVNYSYGQSNNVGNNIPALFSYMSTNSYNGETIESGTEADTENDVFEVFRHNSSFYNQSVLYDLRIYDHSLTAEELQLVKDEMMEDYYRHTEPMKYTHWVADWDAKGRSNDEDEPARSQWIDKATGKVIDLHNYAYAGMSGWNGYPTDFIEDNWVVLDTTAYQKDLVTVESLRLQFKGTLTDGHTSCGMVLSNGRIPEKAITYWLRVKGIKGNQIVRLRNESISPIDETILREDGIIEMNISRGPTSGSLYIYMFSPNADTPDVDITIDMLPIYPGHCAVTEWMTMG